LAAAKASTSSPGLRKSFHWRPAVLHSWATAASPCSRQQADVLARSASTQAASLPALPWDLSGWAASLRYCRVSQWSWNSGAISSAAYSHTLGMSSSMSSPYSSTLSRESSFFLSSSLSSCPTRERASGDRSRIWLMAVDTTTSTFELEASSTTFCTASCTTHAHNTNWSTRASVLVLSVSSSSGAPRSTRSRLHPPGWSLGLASP
ncbi:unnamed protein product, partial [Ixodes hexagonus]